jgi:hypothetical protein
MTQDEIIEMARQVEFNVGFKWCVNFIELEAFAKLVATKERFECIGIAWDNGAVDVADAIRARGDA